MKTIDFNFVTAVPSDPRVVGKIHQLAFMTTITIPSRRPAGRISRGTQIAAKWDGYLQVNRPPVGWSQSVGHRLLSSHLIWYDQKYTYVLNVIASFDSSQRATRGSDSYQ